MIKHAGAVCILVILLGTTALSPVAAGNKKPSIGAHAHTGSGVHIVKKPTKVIPHETAHVIQQTKGRK
jgi:hypothetical protein